MTQAEKEATNGLLLNHNEDNEDNETPHESPAKLSFGERLAQDNKRKRDQSTTQESYVNTKFILGSAAEVERLWSTAEAIKLMTPMMLETLLFLKTNARFWNINVVRQAMRAVQNDDSSARLEKYMKEVETQGDADDFE